MSLESLIEAKKKKIADLGDPGDDQAKKLEKAKAESELEALEEAEADKEVFSQDDLNAREKVAKEKANQTVGKIEKMFGTSIDSVEAVLENFDNVLPKSDDDATDDASGDGDTSGKDTDSPVLNRALSTIKDQQKKIDTLTNTSSEFQRSYFRNQIEQNLATQFQSLGLSSDYQPAASSYLENVVGVSDLVEKKMKGEEVTEEEIKGKVEEVKTASPVWFQPVPNPDLPSIPVTPSGDPPKQLTDEERREASNKSGGKVF